jgi:hypothetical protein
MLKIIRHNRDSTKFNFTCDDTIKENGSYVHYGENRIIIHPKQIENMGFWVHELTEVTIIKILNSNSFRKPWRRTLYFKDYNPCRISHLISMYGLNNGRNLEPQIDENIPEW